MSLRFFVFGSLLALSGTSSIAYGLYGSRNERVLASEGGASSQASDRNQREEAEEKSSDCNEEEDEECFWICYGVL